MKNKRGFTLIEIVIVIALIGIILSVIYSPMTFSYKNFASQSERTSAISHARSTMDYLTREIRKSDEIKIISDGKTIEPFKIEIDSIPYKIENRKLFKGDEEVREGIDEIKISDDGTIEITIIIKYSEDKEYELKSTLNIRKG